MLIKKRTGTDIPSSEITPESVYLSRRAFMGSAAVAAGAALLAACAPKTDLTGQSAVEQAAAPRPTGAPTIAPGSTSAAQPGIVTDEFGDPLTTFAVASSYNNYYEFSTNKEAVAGKATDFQSEPWTVQVSGMVNNPKTFDLDALRALGDEERIYRLRCVEGWSMIIPWNGFPLARMLEIVEPTSAAKYVRFETVYRPEEMPGQRNPFFEWPYVEGLRLDEAMHDLTLMATGMYGRDLPNQNGAPFRLVVPWKYGFKSIKSIVKIDLTDEMPTSLWMAAAPQEYGFYANVNPEVDHPRWSQATERRIGEAGRRPTLKFNGYEEQVAYLYEGMDLEQNY